MSVDWTAIKAAIRTWIITASGLDSARVIWAGRNAGRPAGVTTAWISLGRPTERSVGPDWLAIEDEILELDDDVVEAVDTGADTLTLTAHAYLTGDGPLRLETDDVPPAAADTDYWAIKIDDDTIQLAETFAHAMAGTGVVALVAGSGTHTIVATDETVRAGQEIRHYARGNRVISIPITCFPPAEEDDATSAHAILSACVAKATLPTYASALSAALGMSQISAITPIDGVVNSTRFEPRAVMTVTFFAASETSETGTIIETAEIENETESTTFFVPEDPTP